MTPADILDRAADYIDNHGWTRGKLEHSNGGVCAEGAIRAVSSGAPWGPFGDERHARVAFQALSSDVTSVPIWNDTQDSAHDVMAQLRSTAQRLRGVA